MLAIIVRPDPSCSTTPSTALRASAFSGQALALGMTPGLWVLRSSPWGQAGIVGLSGEFKVGFRIGLGNVIFLWQSQISGEKKHLVLLISQKDYEQIKKYEVWDSD